MNDGDTMQLTKEDWLVLMRSAIPWRDPASDRDRVIVVRTCRVCGRPFTTDADGTLCEIDGICYRCVH